MCQYQELKVEFNGLIGYKTDINMKKRFLLLAMFFLFTGFCICSQTVVNVEKPGKLKSRIGKDASKITALKIIGKLNEKDVSVFNSLTSVTYLDLSEVVFQFKNKSIKWKDEKGKHEVTPLENEIPLFSTMPLKNLYLPYTIPNPTVYGSNSIKILDEGQIHLDNIYTYYLFPMTRKVKTGNIHVLSSVKHVATSSPQTYIKAFENLYFQPHDSKKYRVKIDTLFISSIGNVSPNMYTVCVLFNPSVIVCVKEGVRLLKDYRGNDSIVDLKDFDGIGALAFANSKVRKVKLGKKIKTIPNECFYGCNELTEISGFENIKAIGDYAFYGTRIKNFVFGDSLVELSSSAFVNSDARYVEIKARYAPKLTRSRPKYKVTIPDEAFDLITFVVPQDAKYYSSGEWKNKCVIRKGVKNAYTFTVETPGSLHQQIPPYLAPQIVELTIKGFLYETDFMAIRGCKNLRSIDLSHCFPMKSPYLQKEEREEEDVLNNLALALFGMAADYKLTKANVGIGNVTDAVEGTMYKGMYDYLNLMKTYDTNEFKADASCWMPEDGLKGLRFLEKVIYPNQLKVLNTGVDSKILKEIGFPPFVEDIKCTFTSDYLNPASVKKIRQLGGRIYH